MARARPGQFEPPDIPVRPPRPDPVFPQRPDPVFPPKRPPVPSPFPFPLPVPPAPTEEIPPPTVVTPIAAAPDLQIMLSAIQVAQDEHVITGDFHNALRLALVAIANRFGMGLEGGDVTITNAARLSPASPVTLAPQSSPWDHEYGFVKKPNLPPTIPGNVRGWMELELPHGARIKKMLVFGTTKGAGTLRVKLKRQKVTDPAVAIDLIVIEIPDGADPTKGIEGDVTVPAAGAGAVAIEEFRIVNNREQKYLLAVELEGSNVDTTAQFRSVQVVCGR